MHRFVTFLALAVAASPSIGCASVFSAQPSVLEVEVREPPPGAIVVVREEESRQSATYTRTPVRVKLNKQRNYTVSVSAPGYEPVVDVVRSRTQPLFWMNTLPFGLLALTIPAAIGGSIATGAEGLIGGLAMSAGVIGIGAAGMAIDMGTGHAWRHDRSRLTFELLRSEE